MHLIPRTLSLELEATRPGSFHKPRHLTKKMWRGGKQELWSITNFFGLLNQKKPTGKKSIHMKIKATESGLNYCPVESTKSLWKDRHVGSNGQNPLRHKTWFMELPLKICWEDSSCWSVNLQHFGLCFTKPPIQLEFATQIRHQPIRLFSFREPILHSIVTPDWSFKRYLQTKCVLFPNG